MRGASGLLAAALLLGASGCHTIKPPVTAATLNVADLPSEPAALEARAAALFDARDPVALENVLVVCDRLLVVDPRSYAGAWQAARAAFWLADGAGTNRDRRAWFADRGAKYGARAVASDDKRVEGHYFRGINLGYLAQTMTLGALDLVGQIHAAAKAAVAIDPAYDHAGPLRLLGGLLLNAPGWPASVGDPDEAVEQLAQAVATAGDFPLNRLLYAQALARTDKPAEAARELDEADRLAALPENAWMRARLVAESAALRKRLEARKGR